jgi:hypothetical protein
MLPRDLHEPFSDSDERAQVVAQLLDRCRQLEALEKLARVPMERWRPEEVEQLVGRRMAEHGALRPQWLTRWQELYADELRQLRQARAAAVHERLSDLELRAAAYLAGRLLAAALGSLDELQR